MQIELASAGLDGVAIRQFTSHDAYGVLEAVVESGEHLARFETWARPPFGIENAAEYVGWWTEGWGDQSAFFFAIVSDERIFGACGLFDIRSDRSASIGYWVRSSETGKGIATGAAGEVAAWGFETLGLDWIDLQVSDSNPASVRVAQKLGAHREGDLDADRSPLTHDTAASAYRLLPPSLRKRR